MERSRELGSPSGQLDCEHARDERRSENAEHEPPPNRRGLQARLMHPRDVVADQQALLRLAGGVLRGVEPAVAWSSRSRFRRRSAASRFRSACLVESAAIAAARRSAELARGIVGRTDTLNLYLAPMTSSLILFL